MSGTWLVSTANNTPATAYDTQAEADRAIIALKPTMAVAWYCDGVEETTDAPQTPVTAPVAADGVVERVLGHLAQRIGRQIEDTREAS